MIDLTNSIDVHKVATEIFREIEDRTETEFSSLLEKLKDTESQTEQQAILFHGILDISKKHSERFAVALVQKVVDELKTTSGMNS